MKAFLANFFRNKKVMILGYGKEGKSSFRLLRSYFPDMPLAVADEKKDLQIEYPELTQDGITLFCGMDYTRTLAEYDIIIKAPGLSIFKTGINGIQAAITSQTDLFLQAYAHQITGITGTKGKSTTASLLYHIINIYSSNTLLAGNIGIPLFDMVDRIDGNTRVVCELSSHQLEFISKSPSTAVLLNLFQEHLDHYASFSDYQMAKFQIALKQEANNHFIYNPEDTNITNLLREYPVPGILWPIYTSYFNGDGSGLSGENFVFRKGKNETILLPCNFETKLMGIHNLRNIIVAATAANISGIPFEAIAEGVATFGPLKHRIEFLGIHNGKYFYNDSISTIPEACLAALETLGTVDTLILGGFDRDIEYELFIKELCRKKKVNHIVFNGPAGERMMKILQSEKCHKPSFEFGSSFEEAVYKAIASTPDKGICLLSPAASSYDSFSNFEARGSRFEALIKIQ
ncbi:MAG: UDP-N-acetylmuramoyl-L-alanine--D-glutamate ligase [Lentimicrobium sp.]|nr:UDP-N-acetylmuramoyl-L-alanine--D-glutamate ligase [Lentimicrobium sp.]